jgi:DNA-binding transcriptional MerR regulator
MEELRKLKVDETMEITELSTLTGERVSTLKYYSEQGILPFEQKGEGLRRKFRKDMAVKRLNEIKKLKEKGFSIPQIIDYYRKEA